MKHAVHRINLVMISLLIVIFLSMLFVLSRNVMLANGKLSVLYMKNNCLPKDNTQGTYSDPDDLLQCITGSWDIYSYDLRSERRVVGLLLLQKNGTYTVEFFQSTEEGIRDAFRANVFILEEPQGTFQCTMLDSESRQNLSFADEDTIADCVFTTKNPFKHRMLIELKNVHGTPRLFLVHPAEPSSMFVWSIEKSATAE